MRGVVTLVRRTIKPVASRLPWDLPKQKHLRTAKVFELFKKVPEHTVQLVTIHIDGCPAVDVDGVWRDTLSRVCDDVLSGRYGKIFKKEADSVYSMIEPLGWDFLGKQKKTLDSFGRILAAYATVSGDVPVHNCIHSACLMFPYVQHTRNELWSPSSDVINHGSIHRALRKIEEI